MSASDELAQADRYTNPLDSENAAEGSVELLAAHQGQALRKLIYYCVAAIVAAIEDRPVPRDTWGRHQ